MAGEMVKVAYDGTQLELAKDLYELVVALCNEMGSADRKLLAEFVRQESEKILLAHDAAPTTEAIRFSLHDRSLIDGLHV
jgi:hypothetical protein